MIATATLSAKFQISVPKAGGVQFVAQASDGGFHRLRHGHKRGADLLTCDRHFEGLSSVVYLPKEG